MAVTDRDMIFKNISTKHAMPFLFLLPLILIALQVNICLGYIIPSEQVIEFMTGNFSGFRTIAITQNTRQADNMFYNEQIFMKSPDLIYRKVMDMDRTSSSETSYYTLLMANNPSMIKHMLSALHINLDIIEYAKTDGTIAYCIGDKDPMSPKLLVEKGRFLPLLLKYRSPDDPYGDIITVEFKDYRELDNGWFPFEIIYSLDNKMVETHSIQSVQANISIDPSLFLSGKNALNPDMQTREKSSNEIENDRLKKIIKTFEEKYN
jgi:hypothetical protein